MDRRPLIFAALLLLPLAGIGGWWWLSGRGAGGSVSAGFGERFATGGAEPRVGAAEHGTAAAGRGDAMHAAPSGDVKLGDWDPAWGRRDPAAAPGGPLGAGQAGRRAGAGELPGVLLTEEQKRAMAGEFDRLAKEGGALAERPGAVPPSQGHGKLQRRGMPAASAQSSASAALRLAARREAAARAFFVPSFTPPEGKRLANFLGQGKPLLDACRRAKLGPQCQSASRVCLTSEDCGVWLAIQTGVPPSSFAPKADEARSASSAQPATAGGISAGASAPGTDASAPDAHRVGGLGAINPANTDAMSKFCEVYTQFCVDGQVRPEFRPLSDNLGLIGQYGLWGACFKLRIYQLCRGSCAGNCVPIDGWTSCMDSFAVVPTCIRECQLQAPCSVPVAVVSAQCVVTAPATKPDYCGALGQVLPPVNTSSSPTPGPTPTPTPGGPPPCRNCSGSACSACGACDPSQCCPGTACTITACPAPRGCAEGACLFGGRSFCGGCADPNCPCGQRKNLDTCACEPAVPCPTGPGYHTPFGCIQC